jgi:primosomal protein N' (replication factor Y)
VVTAAGREAPPVARLKDVEEILPEPWRLEETARSLAAWVASYYACSLGEALALHLPPRPGTRPRRPPWEKAAGEPEASLPLEAAQAAAVGAVGEALGEERFASFLLHGVTGSGKTEVYLHCIERVLAAGKGALVLLPEIALTPQTLRRLTARFPGRVAPYHSRLSHGERSAVWEAAAAGTVPVVVGARSAVFVPVRDLGLIVVDEEHEPSYKADDRPRYHARDVALMRGRMAGVPVILGSATPSLESHHNAVEGKHRLLTLPRRVGVENLPTVEVVDLRGDRSTAGEPLGTRLCAALEETLARGEQAIVFHNRRGFARFLQCHACGHVEECPRCDISLTWHLKDDRLHCHYCGHRRKRPEACGGCGERLLRPKGTGTQRVELALQSRFPTARILRLDQDTTGTKRAHREILDRFGAGEAEILLGTQMVAKGLHFPRVTLVGVVSADAGLHFPDFRAHERAFQLLTQVAGRSGRTGPGRVVLQTFDPEHRVLRRVLDHDVEGFLAEELAQRRALGYPPWRRLAAVTVTAPEEALLDTALDDLARRLGRALAGGPVELLGPARAVLPRINRRWRGQLLLKGGLSEAGKAMVLELFAATTAAVPGGRKLDLALDVDPQQLI